MVVPAPAEANATFSFSRIGGSDRYDTARLAAEAAFPSGSKTVVLANGSIAHFPDALAGSYLAGAINAPVLLTDANTVPAATAQALSELGVTNIAVIGGTAAISSAEFQQLQAHYQVARVAGSDRYQTAAAVATAPASSGVGSVGGQRTAVVALGTNFPDALVMGPLADKDSFPVLLTDPNTLPAATHQALQSLKIQLVLIPGGTGAVSAAVEAQIQALGISTKRFSGQDRTDTAAQVAGYAIQSLGFSAAHVGLARGDDPGDSLASAPYGAVNAAPLLLTVNPTVLGTFTGAFLSSNAGTLASGTIFGGTGAVSQSVQDQATTDARSGTADKVSVAATPSSVVANGTATSAVTVTVTDPSGNPVTGDQVSLATAGSPSGACGSLSPTTGTSDATGKVTSTYTASSTAGTCTITATEANTAATGTATVTQTAPDTVAVTTNPATLTANGSSQSTVTATVTGSGGAPVSGDAVTFTMSGNPAAACGTLSSASGTTNSSGQVSATYTASSTAGFCTITATESQTGGSGTAQIDQTAPGSSTSNPNTVAVSANPSTVFANGTAQSTVTATVDTPSGSPVAGDAVSFSLSGSPSGACGTLSSSSGTTDSSGQASTTYTASKTAGTCTVTAKEANSGGTGSAKITQAAPNTVSLSPSSPQVPADGKSSFQETAHVTDFSGTPVGGDPVTFSVGSASPSGACGTLSATGATPDSKGNITVTTDTSGNAVVTYKSSTTSGFCTLTAAEAKTGSSATAMVTQTPARPANSVAVSATPATLAGNGSSTSTITATVTGPGGGPAANDPVSFSTTGSPSGACGSLSQPIQATDSSGRATVTYTASSSAGTCTITATEGQGGASGSTAVTQITVTVSANPSSVPPDGTSTSTITVTVNGAKGAPVSGDGVTLSTSGTCGTLAPTTGTTNSSGQLVATYTASKSPGTCTITATEATVSASGKTSVSQGADTVTVKTGSSTEPPDGVSHTTVTATVTNSAGTKVSGDQVTFTTSGSPSGACGTLSPTSGATDSSGSVTVTYTTSKTSGSCTITATEAATGASGSATIIQTLSTTPSNTVTVTASPSAVPPDGTTHSTITATVKNSSGVAVTGDQVTFTTSPSKPGSCGPLSSTSGTTDANGQVTTTYTASTTPGQCTITATEAQTASSGSATVSQGVNAVSVSASPSTIGANPEDTSTITVTVIQSGGTAAANDPVTLSLSSATPPGACGSLAPNSGTTDASGKMTATYTASATAGTCKITAVESNTSSTGTTTITQANPAFAGSSETAGQTTITLTYDEPIVCATVDPGGSDYSVTVNGAPLATTFTAACPSPTDVTSTTVKLTIASGFFQSTQVIVVTAKAGSDGNTVFDQSASQQPLKDNTTHTVA